jgi:hypothetical protein
MCDFLWNFEQLYSQSVAYKFTHFRITQKRIAKRKALTAKIYARVSIGRTHLVVKKTFIFVGKAKIDYFSVFPLGSARTRIPVGP